MKISLGFALIFVLLILNSCKKNEDAVPDFSSQIQSIVPQSIIDDLQKRGMQINTGLTPPNIEGIFTSSPHILVSSYEGDSYQTGDEFGELTIKFSNQNNEDESVSIDLKQASQVGTGLGGFIAGSGNKFTLFAELDVTNGTVTSKQIRVFSGEITEDGIKDFYTALIMKEKNDPDNTLIEVGQGRIIKDGDGLAAKTSTFRIGASATSISLFRSDNAHR
jgi:PBP1b-binding outer membrane lipoprotein LpoB